MSIIKAKSNFSNQLTISTNRRNQITKWCYHSPDYYSIFTPLISFNRDGLTSHPHMILNLLSHLFAHHNMSLII